MTTEITEAPATARPADTDNDDVKTLRIVRNLLERLPWLRRRLIGSVMAKLPHQDYVEEWLKVYASERNVKFNEMEYHLPLEEGAKALREIIALLETSFPRVYFPIEVRVVAPDDLWLRSTGGRVARLRSITACRRTRCRSSGPPSRSFVATGDARTGARCTA